MRKLGGKYQPVEILSEKINKPGTYPFNAWISPDESFLIACIDGIPVDYNPGFVNYFVFFRGPDDQWSDAIPFGPEINIKGSNAMSASVSADGKYLFFAAQVTNPLFTGSQNLQKLGQIIELSSSPQNGNYDIYWVDAGVIQGLKP